ncbi:type II and III secretion system protein [bacterium]|nr:type II and III secretion system protein [bacterium]
MWAVLRAAALAALLVCTCVAYGAEKKEQGEAPPPPPDPFAQRQIYIEVLVVETDYDADHSTGVIHEYLQRVNGELRGRPYTGDPDDDRGSLRPSIINFPTLPNEDTGTQIVGTADLDTGLLRSTLQALVESGKARVLSKPSILVLNGKQGVIQAGEQVPYLARVLGNKDTVLATSHKDTGITMKVTPTIWNEWTVDRQAPPEEVMKWSRYIVLDVEADDRVLTRYRKEASNPMPIFDVRKQNTTVVVESGRTFMMGGLLRQRDSRAVTGIPVLADVPVAGRAFSSHKESKVTKELSITITPTILADEVALAGQIDRTLDLSEQIRAEQRRVEQDAANAGSIEEKFARKRQQK